MPQPDHQVHYDGRGSGNAACGKRSPRLRLTRHPDLVECEECKRSRRFLAVLRSRQRYEVTDGDGE